LINLFFDNAWSAFLLQHDILFVLTGIFAFKLAHEFSRNANQAFFFALMPISSAQSILWLNHTLINVEGIFLLYFAFWMLIDYVNTPEDDLRKKRRKIWLYSIAYGLLMLGKAQYNIAIAIVTFVVLFERRRLREAIVFFSIQLAIVPIWAIVAKFAFSANYTVYEVSRRDFSLFDLIVGNFGSFAKLYHLPNGLLFGAVSILNQGTGLIVTFAVLLSIGYFLREKLGKFLVVYFLATSFFLLIVQFLIPRHAGDLAIIGYAGIAVAIDTVRRNLSNQTRLFWPGFAIVFACWVWFNMSHTFEAAIIG